MRGELINGRFDYYYVSDGVVRGIVYNGTEVTNAPQEGTVKNGKIIFQVGSTTTIVPVSIDGNTMKIQWGLDGEEKYTRENDGVVLKKVKAAL